MQNNDKEKIAELTAHINALSQNLQNNRNALKFLPTVQLANTINKGIKLSKLLYSLPPIAWDVMYKFLLCQNKELARLAVDQLKVLVEILAAHAEMELEAISDADEKKKWQDWLAKCNDAIQNWKADYTVDQAAAVLAALKQWLIDNAGTILKVLNNVFSEEINQAIDDWAKKQTGKVVRNIIDEMLRKIILRRFGEEIGKKMIPYVGLILTAVELAAYGIIIDNIKDIEDEINRTLVELVKLMEKSGWGWPNVLGDNTGMLYKGRRATWEGSKITYSAFVRCASQDATTKKWTWTRCPVSLTADTKKNNSVVLDETFWNDKRKLFVVPLLIDKDSVEASKCYKNGQVCYTFMDIRMELPDKTKVHKHQMYGAKTVK